MDLVTSGEIAGMLSVSRARVGQLAARESFPAPKIVAGGGRVKLWERADIEAWIAGWDRTNVGGSPAHRANRTPAL